MSLDAHATTGINSCDPSPEEIAALCAEIRAGWSEREHYRRAGQKPPGDFNLRRRERNEESEPMALATDKLPSGHASEPICVRMETVSA